MSDTGGLVRADGPDPQIVDILTRHFDLMRATSPAESCHVMAPDDLFQAGATVLVWRNGAQVLGIGALKPLDADHGELKSMHTVAEARGRGIARAVLTALIDEARARGLTRVSLETGSADMFAPARALYAREGFTECAPFGSYVTDPLSTFMTRPV